jgi:hypothetical protein
LGAACLLLLVAGWLGPEAWGSPTPPPSPAAPPPPPPPGAPGGSQDTCTSCGGGGGGFRRPEELGRVDGDFLEAVKRHILSRLQLRGRPNITHAVPKAAMVTALRKLHAGKVREDGRVEIPHLDGHASPGADGQERVSEIISFAETGGFGHREARGGRDPSLFPSPRKPCCLHRLCSPHAPRAFRLRAETFCGGLARFPGWQSFSILRAQTTDPLRLPFPCSNWEAPCPSSWLTGIGPQRLWARVPLPADARSPGSAGTCLVIA